MQNNIDKIAILIHGMVAIGGGLAGSLAKRQRRIVEIISNMFIGGFTGTMAMFISMHFLGDQFFYLNSAIAGSFGYAGPEGMRFLFGIAKKAIQANIK